MLFREPRIDVRQQLYDILYIIHREVPKAFNRCSQIFNPTKERGVYIFKRYNQQKGEDDHGKPIES